MHYLPSYSPDLNPDEHLNCDLKAELAKGNSKKNKTEFQAQTKSVMRSLAKQLDRVKRYFNLNDALEIVMKSTSPQKINVPLRFLSESVATPTVSIANGWTYLFSKA